MGRCKPITPGRCNSCNSIKVILLHMNMKRERRFFYPLLSLFLWSGLIAVIFFIPPQNIFIILAAFLLLFSALLITGQIILHQWPGAFIIAIFFIFIPVLQILQLLTWPIGLIAFILSASLITYRLL